MRRFAVPALAGLFLFASATGGLAAENPPAPVCPPEPSALDPGALLGMQRHVPALDLTLATPLIPSDQPIALHVAFPNGTTAPEGDGIFAAGKLKHTPAGTKVFPLPVLSWIPAGDKKSADLTLGPVASKDLSSLPHLTLVVIACANGGVTASAELRAGVSVHGFSVVGAFVITALFYLLAVSTLALPAGVNRRQRLNPVWLAQDGTGRASLSSMQIIFFSVIVLYLVTYILLRTGLLADLSSDVLALLGIAGVGSVGGKLATNSTHKLGFDNWSWAKRKGWIAADGNHVSRPQWSDLFTTDDDFDPYKFQMLSFSFVIGISLLGIGLNGLANFTIPQALLAVIGLSQATYLGGKVVASGNFGALDDKLTALRQAETDFLTATATSWQPPTAPANQLPTAITLRPTDYMKFKALVGPAWTMFQELFVARGTNPSLEPGP